jgi:hypothetical protein
MIRGFAPGIFDDELRMRNTTDTSMRRKPQTLYLVSGFRLHQVRVRATDCDGAFGAYLIVSYAEQVSPRRRPLLVSRHALTPRCGSASSCPDYLQGTKCFPAYSEDVEETAPFRTGVDGNGR